MEQAPTQQQSFLKSITRLDYIVTGILLALASAAILISLSSAFDWTLLGLSWFDNWLLWVDSFFQNFGTEMIGAAFTFFLIEIVVGARETRRAETLQQTIADATREQIRSFIQGQELARLLAAETPEERAPILRTMIQTDMLRGANLSGADLQEADLRGAILEKTSLRTAKLQGATLIAANIRSADLLGANLQGADVWSAKLQRADLRGASLQGADLHGSNLQEARLWEANLQAANMIGANLQGARLRATIFNTDTLLPDGITWNSDIDMDRFTDSENPNFWRSDEYYSPAYKGANDQDDPHYEEWQRRWGDKE